MDLNSKTIKIAIITRCGFSYSTSLLVKYRFTEAENPSKTMMIKFKEKIIHAKSKITTYVTITFQNIFFVFHMP